jgi:hypothetical protein
MDNQPLFSEQQYFKQWWIWVVLLSLNGLILYGMVSQVFFGQIFGDKPMGNTGLVILFIIQTAFTVFFMTQCLATKIDDKGVYVKFRPYHRKWRLYTWEAIAECEVEKYNPMDYGGWGLRQGAYTMSGSMGLKLTFKSGKPSLVIGTQKPDEIKTVLEKLGKL